MTEVFFFFYDFIEYMMVFSWFCIHRFSNMSTLDILHNIRRSYLFSYYSLDC